MADFLDTGLISIELMAGRPGVAGRLVLTKCQRDLVLALAARVPPPAFVGPCHQPPRVGGPLQSLQLYTVQQVQVDGCGNLRALC
jgi:hypothetical protein